MDNLSTTIAEPNPVGWQFDNTYSRLSDVFFAPAKPKAFSAPRLVILNHRLANELGLDLRSMSPEAAAVLFSGQDLPAGSQPIAQAYAGHQFGNFTMLGDGRAILLGEHRTRSGKLVDIQLKGAGQTPYSRRGDGLAALGPMLREYIISEAMFALGIPTTRSLAVVTTGEPVYRETKLPGAILTRVAASHIRVGTFEYVAAAQGESELRALADYTIHRHYPDLMGSETRYADFFRAVMDRQAALIAQWQLVGFIHGVMNTDNMAISGESIDYGPCAFMNSYRPETVFSSIDRAGRYAYRNQPAIAQWNLTRFAETLLPLIAPEQEQAIAVATEILNQFPALYEQYWLTGMRAKLGLQQPETGDLELAQSLLRWMQNVGADFTNTFRDLSEHASPAGAQYNTADFQEWFSQWQLRLSRENRSSEDARAAMRSVNPAIIPRNHRVEQALSAAQLQGDLSVLQNLLAALESPYESRPTFEQYRETPVEDRSYRTFCGT